MRSTLLQWHSSAQSVSCFKFFYGGQFTFINFKVIISFVFHLPANAAQRCFTSFTLLTNMIYDVIFIWRIIHVNALMRLAMSEPEAELRRKQRGEICCQLF